MMPKGTSATRRQTIESQQQTLNPRDDFAFRFGVHASSPEEPEEPSAAVNSTEPDQAPLCMIWPGDGQWVIASKTTEGARTSRGAVGSRRGTTE